MAVDIEQTLARELREVAEGLDIPAMPLPRTSARPAGRFRPLLVAAAVVTIVAGAAAAVATFTDDQGGGPAQPSLSPSTTPTPSPGESVAPIPRSTPEIPYLLDGRLHVDGGQVPGPWWTVRTGGDAWIAAEGMPVTWWWGRGPEPRELPNGEDVTPKISPSGRYVAVLRAEDGEGVLTVVDTRTGRNLEGTPTSIGPVKWDEGAHVAAVTDDGTVVVGREGGYLTWSQEAVSGNMTGLAVLDATSAGLVVGDLDGERTFLAGISPTGELTRLGDLPAHDDLTVSPDGTWVAWTPIGTTGGETTAVPSLEVGTLDGEQAATLPAPDGWSFRVRTWAWEDDGHLVSAVSDDRGRERLARCSPEQARCVLVEAE